MDQESSQCPNRDQIMTTLRNAQSVVYSLGRSPFRRKFRLSATERSELRQQGVEPLLEQAHALVRDHLAPAQPIDDGKQTPFRGNPIFVAQHGTATCCRRCLEKWHQIPRGRELSIAEQDYIVSVIGCWLRASVRPPPANVDSTAATA